MPENIRAVPIGSGKSSEIEVIQVTPFKGGGMESKRLIEGRLHGHAVSLVERDLFRKEYLSTWQSFKAAGLPVVPTVRINEETGAVLVTDIKADGSETYGKATLYNHERWLFRRRREIDTLFLRLMEPDTFPILERRVRECITIANAHALLLPFDDPFELVVHPDGNWEVMILDLRHGKAVETQDPERAKVAQTNEELGETFLDWLKSLRDRFIEDEIL